ncbi:hypothetical protein SDC9_92367 [bioreactor metagenome]|uniref:Uncharacterized protein n=1 Tax=bioreactor metagenome TaxID=1076179 RepID=A0A644ZY45_9ZZZZ
MKLERAEGAIRFNFVAILLTSHFLADQSAEKPGGLYQQHHDQHREHNGVGQLCGDIGPGKNLDHTKQQPPKQSPRDGADAAEHGGGKRLDARHGAGGGHQRGICRAQQNSRDGRQARPDGKGHRDGEIHIDAHELRRALVLRHSPHGLAHFGSARKRGQRQHDHEARGHRDHRRIGDAELAAEQGHAAFFRKAEEGGKNLGVRAPQQQRRILEEVAHADGGDQHSQRWRGAQGLVRQPLHHDAQHRAAHHRQQHGGQRVPTEIGGGAKAQIPAHHNHVTVGKIQHFGDTVDHSVAQSDDGINAAQADAADQIGEDRHSKRHLLSQI